VRRKPGAGASTRVASVRGRAAPDGSLNFALTREMFLLTAVIPAFGLGTGFPEPASPLTEKGPSLFEPGPSAQVVAKLSLDLSLSRPRR